MRAGPPKVKGVNTGRGTTRPQRRGGIALAFGFLALCAVAAAIAVPNLRAPGLYYDEVIQAEPAVEFLAKDGSPLQIPGARSVWLCGRWFPVMTQAYMGALKSQALIPVFALFGPTPESLRLATLSFALLGLLFALLWARLALGLPVALVAGALLAVDPSFLFTSRHDWGSFALGFLCRCGGLYFVTSGFRRGSIDMRNPVNPVRIFSRIMTTSMPIQAQSDERRLSMGEKPSFLSPSSVVSRPLSALASKRCPETHSSSTRRSVSVMALPIRGMHSCRRIQKSSKEQRGGWLPWARERAGSPRAPGREVSRSRKERSTRRGSSPT